LILVLLAAPVIVFIGVVVLALMVLGALLGLGLL
jgi:hypothetical protein